MSTRDLSGVAWRTSSYSANAGNCVEVGVWRTSSYSSNSSSCVEVGVWRTSSYSSSGANCVEVSADAEPRLLARDSKNPTGPVLAFPPASWAAFNRAVADEHA